MTTLTHGKSRRGKWSPEYFSWASMIQRCTNPARNGWHLYGGRGIGVCDRWRNFENFMADMGARPACTSLGRVDQDWNYCPENCEWQDGKSQARSRRSNKLDASAVASILASKESYRELGRRFGVSKTMIGHIKRGSQWTTA